MCDYSLHGIANRLAEEGEVLVVHRFYSGSTGLTSPEYLKPTEHPRGWMAVLKSVFAAKSRVCAVCVPDGAQLLLHEISPSLQQTYDLCTTDKLRANDAGVVAFGSTKFSLPPRATTTVKCDYTLPSTFTCGGAPMRAAPHTNSGNVIRGPALK